jgi:methyl-accepting chemotaxis protein
MSEMNSSAKAILDECATAGMAAADLVGPIRRIRSIEYEYLLSNSKEEDKRCEEQIAQEIGNVAKTQKTYEATIRTDENRALYQTYKDAWNRYAGLHDQLMVYAGKHDVAHGRALMNGPMRRANKANSDSVDALKVWTAKHAGDLARTAQDLYANAVKAMIGFLILGLLIALTASRMIESFIRSHIATIRERVHSLSASSIPALCEAIGELGNGNLDSKEAQAKAEKCAKDVHHIVVQTRDEFGELEGDINGIIDHLRGAVISFSSAQNSMKEMIERAHSNVIGSVSRLNTDALAPLCKGISAMAVGDFTCKVDARIQKMDVTGDGEFAKLAVAVNGVSQRIEEAILDFAKMQDALSELIGHTRTSSQEIAHSSQGLASNSQDLSDRTSHQASSLEETASSMEEMTATVKQNAANAQRANALAKRAMEIAREGGDIVGKAVYSMSEISVASNRINDIISVIDEIAFQTNLLALNAAVEAARVGEQGKGFAVVAGEVRSLAGRSSTAAKEIKQLVLDSVCKVKEGSQYVGKSGQQLKEIVESIVHVGESVAEISAASQEQAMGIEQVNQAVAQMDQITQQNAALVQETAASSDSMSQQAEELSLLVQKFKIDRKHETAIFQSESVRKNTDNRPPAAPRKKSPAASSKPALKLVGADDKMSEF